MTAVEFQGKNEEMKTVVDHFLLDSTECEPDPAIYMQEGDHSWERYSNQAHFLPIKNLDPVANASTGDM